MSLRIRLERPAEQFEVECLVREAFWGQSRPDCDEHLVTHRLRKSPVCVAELNYVAELNGRLVGQIIYSKSKIVDGKDQSHQVLTFGPLSVLPAFRNQGVGKALMEHTIAEAKGLDYPAIVFYGEPDYYPRFGFQRGSSFQITSWSGHSFDALMAMPLFEGALDNISGRFWEDPVFKIEQEELEAFEKQFPFKEKQPLVTTQALLEKLNPIAQQSLDTRGITTLGEFRKYSGREVAAWPGIDAAAQITINQVMTAHGYGKKIWI